eukprot:5673383-Prymnesium_polylepis.1
MSYDVLQHVGPSRSDQAGRRAAAAAAPSEFRRLLEARPKAYLLFAEGDRAPLLHQPPLPPIAVTA